jgi:hypothetical protein
LDNQTPNPDIIMASISDIKERGKSALEKGNYNEAVVSHHDVVFNE